MAVYRIFTFNRLMTESERALWRTDSHPDYYRGPICQLLDDGRRYQHWEASHSLLMRHVADAARPLPQALALRATAVRLVHRRGLFDYARAHQVRGVVRERLFAAFYGAVDYRAAVLREHRQYVLAASSGYCSEVLVGSMEDTHSLRLIERYERMYRDYFEVYGRFISAEATGDHELAMALKSIMLKQRAAVDGLRGAMLAPVRERIRPQPPGALFTRERFF